MNRAFWNSKAAVGGMLAIALGLGVHIGSQAQPATNPSPLRLPGHRYDLPATLIKAAQIEAHKQSMVAVNETDVAMTMVKMGGGSDASQIEVSVVLRPKGQVNPYYAVHDDVAEVYYVIEGKGRMKVGGTITDWERRPISIENGEGSRGKTAIGAKDVDLAKGDMLIIPAGTPHKWEGSDDFTYYAVVRADPKGVAPLLELGKAKFESTGPIIFIRTVSLRGKPRAGGDCGRKNHPRERQKDIDMRRIILGVLIGLAPCAATVFAAEGHAPGIVKTESQIKSELDKSTSALGIVAGQATSIVETGTGQIVVRRRQEGPNNASVHDDVTEIYNIVGGSGTFVTGGAFASASDRIAGISGGVSRHIQAGDFVVLPPGTPHWFSKIDGSITYVETRFAVKK